MKRSVSLLLVAAFLCVFAACGGGKENAGEWSLAAAETEGLLVEPAVLELTASLVLEKDGSGRLTIDEDGYAIRSWSVKDGAVSIQTLDETVEGRLLNGYIVLVFDDGICLYFAREGGNAPALPLLNRAEYEAAYAALVESGEAMPLD